MKSFFTFLFLLLMLNACSLDNTHKNQTKYAFIDQNQQNIQFWSNFDTLEIDTEKSKNINKVTLIMFLNLNSEDVKKYIYSINHLKETFPKVSIIGILTQHFPQQEIDEYIKINNIDFPILNPNDKKNIFTDFTNKINSNESTTSNNIEKKSSLEIPYFILYNKNGKKYQTYSGTIVEEIFTHDISTLLKLH
ncbi:hypothetical protein [Helicobacter sp. 13S00477-4]|uniref:hypothetical protein n=1 Tax=Helicobacter sp. 13S00477-4 TaxID=1905759 RepID=UPI000BA6A1FA|nr:hypothetical protein [Helicobacter sp. 13S00477-4]PAF51266.1 hypothetical protein BKH44_06050 [Helicobacter sp. 13S00477-4]